jgi:hypothetical protein
VTALATYYISESSSRTLVLESQSFSSGLTSRMLPRGWVVTVVNLVVRGTSLAQACLFNQSKKEQYCSTYTMGRKSPSPLNASSEISETTFANRVRLVNKGDQCSNCCFYNRTRALFRLNEIEEGKYSAKIGFLRVARTTKTFSLPTTGMEPAGAWRLRDWDNIDEAIWKK